MQILIIILLFVSSFLNILSLYATFLFPVSLFSLPLPVVQLLFIPLLYFFSFHFTSTFSVSFCVSLIFLFSLIVRHSFFHARARARMCVRTQYLPCFIFSLLQHSFFLSYKKLSI